MKQTSNNILRYIIIDTSIVENFTQKGLEDQILSALRDAVQNQYGLAISNITIFELLDTATVDNELKATNALMGLKRFYVNTRVLTAAARLGCLFGEDKTPFVGANSGDKIIGATSILTNSLIYTSNPRDFPTPFFRELVRTPLTYIKKGQPVTIQSVFLEPDLSFITTKLHERMSKFKKALKKS